MSFITKKALPRRTFLRTVRRGVLCRCLEEFQAELHFNVGRGAAEQEHVSLPDAAGVVGVLEIRQPGCQRLRATNHEIAVEDEQLLQRHDRHRPLFAGDVRIGEVERGTANGRIRGAS